MHIKSTILLSVLALAGCAYTMDESIQDLTIETPGAYNALCDVYVDGFRYVFHPPQTRSIFRSNEDLVVDCKAPGNRHKKLVFKPHLNQSTHFNVANGVVPGLLWDYQSGAMFNYPDTIEVDFTAMPTRPMPVSGQNTPDLPRPDDNVLEEFLPGLPRLNSDRNHLQAPIQKRQKPGMGSDEFNSQSSSSFSMESQSSEPFVGKGDLMSVIERLDNTSMDPAGVSSEVQSSGVQVGGDDSNPVQLFPIE